MAAFDASWMERWRTLVNQDEVAHVIGRHFTADVLLEFGTDAYVVSFVDGRAAKVAGEIGPETTWTFALRGPADGWRKFVQPIPPPMFNDIWAMAHPLHGRLTIEGDVKVMWQNLRAFTWVLDRMRDVDA
jgi:hypothetical protein